MVLAWAAALAALTEVGTAADPMPGPRRAEGNSGPALVDDTWVPHEVWLPSAQLEEA